jgi:hypothetical protein
MAAALGDAANITYADDSNTWAFGKDIEAVVAKLEELADRFVRWARRNGLAVNASKTQFLLSSNGGAAKTSPSTSTAKPSRPRPSSTSWGSPTTGNWARTHTMSGWLQQ